MKWDRKLTLRLVAVVTAAPPQFHPRTLHLPEVRLLVGQLPRTRLHCQSVREKSRGIKLFNCNKKGDSLSRHDN